MDDYNIDRIRIGDKFDDNVTLPQVDRYPAGVAFSEAQLYAEGSREVSFPTALPWQQAAIIDFRFVLRSRISQVLSTKHDKAHSHLNSRNPIVAQQLNLRWL